MGHLQDHEWLEETVKYWDKWVSHPTVESQESKEGNKSEKNLHYYSMRSNANCDHLT